MSKDDVWQRWQALVATLDQRQRVGLIGKLVTTPVEQADEIDAATLDDEEWLVCAERWSATHLAPTLRAIVASAASPADLRGSLDRDLARSEGLPLGVAASLLELDLELPQQVVDAERVRRFASVDVIDLPRVSIAFDGGKRALQAQPMTVLAFDVDHSVGADLLPRSFRFPDPGGKRALQGMLLAQHKTSMTGRVAFVAAGVHVVAEPDATRSVKPGPPGNVAWVTDVIDPPQVRRSRRVVTGDDVTLRTTIGGALDEQALAAQHIPAEALAGGVRFKIVCDGAQVRLAKAGSRLAATLTSEALEYQGAEPIDFSFVLRASEPGPITVDLFLLLRDRTALCQTLELTAEATAPQLPHIGIDAPAAVTSVDATHLMTLPAPTACVAIDARGPLALDLTLASRRTRLDAATGLDELAAQAIRWRTRLVELSERYQARDELGLADDGATLLAFATIGAEIHRALFGHPDEAGNADLKAAAKSLGDLSGGPLLHIFAEHLPLPWGVVYDGPSPARASDVDPDRFWGHRFLIERIAKASLGDVPAPALRKKTGDATAALIPCINPHVDAAQNVDAARRQIAFFDGLASPLRCAPRIEQRADLATLLHDDRGDARLLYFFCHGNAAATVNDRFFLSRAAPDVEAWLSLDRDEREKIDVAWLRSTRPAPLAGQPLVFLNACSTAQGDREFQSQFLTQFMQRWNVRGLIGTDWKIPTVFADEFARRLLDRFLRGRQALGPAFAATRDEFVAAGNPFPLIYAMYARPDLTVEAP